MKLKLIAPLLLCLFTGSAFAHSYHDDEAPQPPLQQESTKDAKVQAAQPKHSHEAATTQDTAATETPATPPAAEPKNAP